MSKGGLPIIEKQVPNEDNKSEVSFLAKDDSRKPGMGPSTESWSFGLLSANQNSSPSGLSSHFPAPAIIAGGTSKDQEEDGGTV